MAGVIVNELVQIKFDVRNKSHIMSDSEARDFLKTMETSAEKASLKFTQVIACRSIVILRPNNGYQHDQQMMHFKKTVSYAQFLKLINYPIGISNQDWTKPLYWTKNCLIARNSLVLSR